MLLGKEIKIIVLSFMTYSCNSGKKQKGVVQSCCFAHVAERGLITRFAEISAP